MAELNCMGKTEHYSNKIKLLIAYDTNHNRRIDTTEMQQAIADFTEGKLSPGEKNIITHVWELGEDGINKFCRRRPPYGDYGDVDGDGWVSTKDLIYTLRHVVYGFFGSSEYPMTADQKRRADVNGDGEVTRADASIIAKYIVGTYDTYPVSKYLTPDEALLWMHKGLPCYIKCTLPILDMLPGLPYMQGFPILPGFAITTEA